MSLIHHVIIRPFEKLIQEHHNNQKDKNITNSLPSENKESELLTPRGFYSRAEIVIPSCKAKPIHHQKVVLSDISSKNCNEEPIATSLNETIFNNFTLEKGKVDFNQYFNLKENIPNARQLANNFLTKKYSDFNDLYNVKTNAEIVLKCKEYFDNLYDKDSYRIISVGTSPSFITEAMSALGCEVIFLPASSLHHCHLDESLKSNFHEFPNLKIVAEYLYSELTKHSAKNDKKTIVLDFTNSGKSLSMVYRLAKEYCHVSKNNCIAMRLQDLIINATKEQDEHISDDIKQVLDNILNQTVGILSNVPHFNVHDDEKNLISDNSVFAGKHTHQNIFKFFEKNSTPFARVYAFCVLDEINNMLSKK